MEGLDGEESWGLKGDEKCRSVSQWDIWQCKACKVTQTQNPTPIKTNNDPRRTQRCSRDNCRLREDTIGNIVLHLPITRNKYAMLPELNTYTEELSDNDTDTTTQSTSNRKKAVKRLRTIKCLDQQWQQHIWSRPNSRCWRCSLRGSVPWKN